MEVRSVRLDCFARMLIAGALLTAHATAAAAPAVTPSSAQRLANARAAVDRIIVPHTPPSVAIRARAAVVPDDVRWGDGFGTPAFDRQPRAAIEFQGALVVGGYLTRVGDVYCPGVMRWNGAAWEPMGEGLDGALFAFGIVDGALVAVGSFLHPSTQYYSFPLMKWNGSTWTPFGPPLHGTAYAVVADGPDIYVMGFLFASGYTANRVLRLDSGAWVPVGGDVEGDPRALVMWNGQLVLGGRFASIGGVPVRGLAGWDGSAWNEIGGGLTGPAHNLIMSLAVWQGDLIAGGSISNIGGQAISNVARWNGATWSALGAPFEGVVAALLPDEAMLHVGGSFYGLGPNVATVLSTDGTRWSWTDEQPMYGVLSLTRLGGEIVALGPFTEIVTPGPSRRAFWLARRIGSTWQPFEAWSPEHEGFMGIYGPRMTALAQYRGDLLAGGPVQARAEGSAWTSFDGIGTWDGTQWRGIGPGPGPVYMEPSFAVSGDTLEVFGTGGLNRVLQYDRASWRDLGDLDGTPGIKLERYAGRLHALGWMRLAGFAAPEFHLAQWTGSDWVVVDPGFGTLRGLGGPASCITVHDGKLYVAGAFESVGSIPAHGIASWDGTTWSAVGAGVSGVNTMRSHGGRLWVGGSFHQAGGIDALALASWDGQTWSDGGLSDITGGVTALGDYDGALVVGGPRFVSGTHQYAGLAIRDRGGWHAFGSGIEGSVYDFQQIGTSLYVAGDFSTAGGKPSYGLARWDGGLPDRPPAPAQLALATRNPFASSVTFAFTIPAPGSVQLTIHDLAGREVGRPLDGGLGEGTHTVRWSPAGVEPGIYVARLVAAGVESAAKIVYLP
jgi:trimeric autotransporter adhesin